MQLTIRVSEGGDNAADLMQWLLEDPVAGKATFSHGPAKPGEMGIGEVILAVFDRSVEVGALVMAVAAWRETQRTRMEQPPGVRIEHDQGGADVTGASPGEIAETTRALEHLDGSGEYGPDRPGR